MVRKIPVLPVSTTADRPSDLQSRCCSILLCGHQSAAFSLVCNACRRPAIASHASHIDSATPSDRGYLAGLTLAVLSSFGVSTTGGFNSGHALGILALFCSLRQSARAARCCTMPGSSCRRSIACTTNWASTARVCRGMYACFSALPYHTKHFCTAPTSSRKRVQTPYSSLPLIQSRNSPSTAGKATRAASGSGDGPETFQEQCLAGSPLRPYSVSGVNRSD